MLLSANCGVSICVLRLRNPRADIDEDTDVEVERRSLCPEAMLDRDGIEASAAMLVVREDMRMFAVDMGWRELTNTSQQTQIFGCVQNFLSFG
jgi:hypothetical protein